MKLLILGIDGLGEESLNKLRLNRLAALIKSGIMAHPIADNMVSRGWAEIYTGQNAYVSGGFFQIPIIKDHNIRQSQATGVDLVSSHCGDGNLLWSRLKNKGFKVGLFGLPTVTSIQSSCVFSFSATGAGQFKNSIGLSGIHPPALSSKVNYSSPNLGLRIGHGAFLPRDLSMLEQWLQDHLSQYFYTLRSVLSLEDVTALILGSRFVTLYYKFRHILNSVGLNSSDQALKDVLLNAARDFDLELERIINEFNPTDIFVVSDHGIGELQYHVNINELLRELGEIRYESSARSLAKSVARYCRDRLQNTTKNYYRRFNLNNSRAFSIGYTDVIYINDSRFTGPAMTDEQRYKAAAELSNKLAALTRSNELTQFVAFEPLKHSGWTSPAVKTAVPIPLPDIRCRLAEGCVNLERTNGVASAMNIPYGAKEMFAKGFAAEHSGCKSGDTIAAYIGPNKSKFNPQRLTDLYSEILAVADRA